MLITQLSVFVENRAGTLLDITRLLKDAEIDIRALSLADTTDFGIMRLIVSSPEKAAEVLKKADITFKKTDVIAAELDDTPGGFHKVLTTLGNVGVNVEYTYAFLTPADSKAYAILRVVDNEKAVAALKAAGIPVLEDESLYNM